MVHGTRYPAERSIEEYGIQRWDRRQNNRKPRTQTGRSLRGCGLM